MSAARIFGVFLIVGAVGLFGLELAFGEAVASMEDDPTKFALIEYLTCQTQIASAVVSWLMLGLGIALLCHRRATPY